MKKKMLSLMLVLCMLLPYNSVSAHTESDEATAIASAMMEILPIKDAYGMGNVDFTTLSLGNEINIYGYMDDIFVPMGTAYPVLSEGELVSIVFDLGEGQYQVTKGLAEAIREINCSEFTLVYDRNGCHVFDGEEFYLILEANYVDNAKDVIPVDISLTEASNLALTDMYVSANLNLASVPTICSDESYQLTISYVAQNSMNLCWAASMACIVNYKLGEDYTAHEMAEECMGYFLDDTQDISDVETYLQRYLPSYTLEYEHPSNTVIINNLRGNNPIFASFKMDGFGYHDTVIYAYTSLGSIYIMDPDQGILYLNNKDIYGRYCYRNDTTFTYMTLERAICATWS